MPYLHDSFVSVLHCRTNLFFFLTAINFKSVQIMNQEKKQKEAQISHKRPNSILYGVTIIGTFFSLSADLTTHKFQMPDVLTKQSCVLFP